MTKEEAEKEQEKLREHFGDGIGWWFGTRCERCCGVLPRLHVSNTTDMNDCWYECDVCGKRTERKTMPWVAEEAWNNHEYREGQIGFC